MIPRPTLTSPHGAAQPPNGDTIPPVTTSSVVTISTPSKLHLVMEVPITPDSMDIKTSTATEISGAPNTTLSTPPSVTTTDHGLDSPCAQPVPGSPTTWFNMMMLDLLVSSVSPSTAEMSGTTTPDPTPKLTVTSPDPAPLGPHGCPEKNGQCTSLVTELAMITMALTSKVLSTGTSKRDT